MHLKQFHLIFDNLNNQFLLTSRNNLAYNEYCPSFRFDLILKMLQERVAPPEAPDLKIGISMDTRSMFMSLLVPHDQTLVIGGIQDNQIDNYNFYDLVLLTPYMIAYSPPVE